MSKITHAEVRMYRMGTGDCFAIKFFDKTKLKFKLMIDAGTWSGSQEKLEPYVKNLKEYLEDFADVLIVTHEHKDHVHAFDACEELFTDGKFNVGEIWMAWTENDNIKKVKEWKKEYGEKKMALGMAANKMEQTINSEEYKKQLAGSRDATRIMGARKVFSDVLSGFASLHLSVDANKVYKGGLAGMDVVKNKIKNKDIKYFKPGDIIQDPGEADGIKIYVLGPPELYEDVNKEAGREGESYQHNKELRELDDFGAAIITTVGDGSVQNTLLPFDEHYAEPALNDLKAAYDQEDWRKIDFDWLYSAGSFALRMNGLTNNLSLAIAIEFEESGRVMLLPGDAEFGSWASWHKINWNEETRTIPADRTELKPLTEDLLNRTVFYKVAHHLSHNGTAQRLGLEMMKHKDLAAMATLDYEIINDGWKSTMPNRAIIKELLIRTKGRLMIMNEEKLFFDFNEEVPMKEKINEARNRMTSKEKKSFDENFDDKNPLYLQYTVKAV